MTEPMEPKFMDPPPVLRDDVWAKTAETLIARTGEWALIFDGDGQEAEVLAGRIRKQRGAWAGHSWEAVTRKDAKPRSSNRQVYARHISSNQTTDEKDEQ